MAETNCTRWGSQSIQGQHWILELQWWMHDILYLCILYLCSNHMGFMPVNPHTHKVYKDLHHLQTVPRHPHSPSMPLPLFQMLWLTWVVQANLYNSTQMCTPSLTACRVNIGLPCGGGSWDSNNLQDTPVQPNALSPPSHFTTITTTTTTNYMSVKCSTNCTLVSTQWQPLWDHQLLLLTLLCSRLKVQATVGRKRQAHSTEPCCYCTSWYIYNITHLQTHQACVNLLNHKTCETHSKVPYHHTKP